MPSDDTRPTPVTVETDTATSSTAIDWSKAQDGVRMLLEAIGEDPDEAPLDETWRRRVPATFETLSEGTRDTEKPDLRTFSANSDELIIKAGIPVYSLCSHHLLPYHGTAHVAYQPREEVVGLSKLMRYIRWQSHRLTMQEQLTQDIAEGLHTELDAEGVLVEMRAMHLCEAMCGIETASSTTTCATAGNVDEAAKQRFRAAIQREDS